eukprot:299147_1
MFYFITSQEVLSLIQNEEKKKTLDNILWTLHLAHFEDIVLTHKQYLELIKQSNENRGTPLETSLLDNIQIDNEVNNNDNNENTENNQNENDDEEMKDMDNDNSNSDNNENTET